MCLIPGHPHRGAVGTIHHVYEDDPPPHPPRLAVGISWDSVDNGAATGPALEELVLEAGNHLITPRCDGYEVGDSLVVRMAGRGEGQEFVSTSVVARVRHSRYRLTEGGPHSHQPEFELDVNAGNAYQPLLAQEVGPHRCWGNMGMSMPPEPQPCAHLCTRARSNTHTHARSDRVCLEPDP